MKRIAYITKSNHGRATLIPEHKGEFVVYAFRDGVGYVVWEKIDDDNNLLATEDHPPFIVNNRDLVCDNDERIHPYIEAKGRFDYYLEDLLPVFYIMKGE